MRKYDFHTNVVMRKKPNLDMIGKMRLPTSATERDELYANYLAKLDEAVENVSEYPEGKYSGRGIVMCVGGQRYFTCAYVAVRTLRELGCKLPIEFWYLGPYEMNAAMIDLVKPLGVECIDGYKVREQNPVRILNGWELNPYSIIHSKFEEVLFLDADNLPLVDPTFLFDSQQYKDYDAIFWPDYLRLAPTRDIWKITGVEYRDEAEFESGQIVVNKAKCWKQLQVTMFFNENSDFYYRHVWGDKETYHMAWRKLQRAYAMVPHAIQQLPVDGPSRVMCQHWFDGNIIFQHRNLDKWKYSNNNLHIPGFKREGRCRELINELRGLWDGDTTNSVPHTPDVQVIRDWLLTKIYFWYVVNGTTRVLEFKPDGSFGKGKLPHETHWRVEFDGDRHCIVVIGDPRVTCRLYKTNSKVTPTWAGYQPESGNIVILR